jgi:hypothetical protein
MDDSGMDEEDRYGAVVREGNPNKYILLPCESRCNNNNSSRNRLARPMPLMAANLMKGR